MEGFTIIDGVVVLVILLSAILAYARGFVREVMAIAGWVAAAVLAYIFAPQVVPLIKEVPVLNKFLAGSCELSIVASFAAVLAVGLVLMAFFTPLFSSVIRHSILGGLDQGLGFLFGVARGILLVTVAFVVYDRAMVADAIPMVTKSQSARIFSQFQNNINQNIPTDIPGWIVARYEQLVGNCGAPAQEGGDATGANTLKTPSETTGTGTGN